jgi:hypothetical protein
MSHLHIMDEGKDDSWIFLAGAVFLGVVVFSLMTAGFVG